MKLIVLFIIILTGLLFVQFPQEYDNPIFKQFWDTGHFILFTSIFFALTQIQILKNISLLRLFILTSLLSIFIGLITEFTQLLFERNFELKDVFNDLVGGYSGLILSRLNKKNQLKQNLLYFLGFIILFSFATHLFFRSLINQYHIQVKYPILSDFESTFELSRWNSSRVFLSLSDKYKSQGDYSMKADFKATQYPRVYLEHFSQNWSDFSQLSLNIYNEKKHPVDTTIVIYDLIHKSSGYPHDDRFNLIYNLQPGWNEISISLEDIENAPLTRKMNMHSILYIGIWLKQLNEATTLYIDDLRLGSAKINNSNNQAE